MEDISYIKLFRKLLISPIFENEKALKVWIWCLLKATHKGQFVTGRKKAGEELKMKERTVYDYFKLLEKLQMISIKSNNKFSIVTVEKWEDYQVEELKIDNRTTTKQQQSNTNKNVKNIYLFLFNKYKAQIENDFTHKIKIISKCKEDIDYSLLTLEEQDNLFYDLMSIDIIRKVR